MGRWRWAWWYLTHPPDYVVLERTDGTSLEVTSGPRMWAHQLRMAWHCLRGRAHCG